MTLFQKQDVTLHSGLRSPFKIDCDALTNQDIECLAFLLSQQLAPFGCVEGVPRGGLRIAVALQQYCTEGYPTLLIVDDVCTTGNSMEVLRAGRKAIGACIFLRGKCPTWITPLFALTPIYVKDSKQWKHLRVRL